MWQVKQAGQKGGLCEQGPSCRSQAEKECLLLPLPSTPTTGPGSPGAQCCKSVTGAIVNSQPTPNLFRTCCCCWMRRNLPGPMAFIPGDRKSRPTPSWDLSLVFFSSPGSLERSWSTGSWQVLSQKVSQQCALAAKGATRVLGRSKPSTARRSREVTAPHWAARAQPHLKPCVLSWAPQHKEAIKQFARGQRKVPQMVKGLEGKAEEERLRSLALLSVEKRRLRGELSAAYSFLQGGSGGRGADLLPPVTSDRTRGKGMKLPRGTFSWDIRKRFVTEGMLGHRNGLSREAVPAPSLSEFKERLGHALSHMV